jgi:hypothetical protein
MDEAGFQRALITVVIGGSAIVAIAATLLYLAFRSAGRTRYFILIGSLLAFLFVCCFVLFILSFRARA